MNLFFKSSLSIFTLLIINSFVIVLDTFLSEGSLKSQLRRVNKNNCSYAIIVGEAELKNDQVIWKDLSDGGEQEILTSKEVIDKYTNL